MGVAGRWNKSLQKYKKKIKEFKNKNKHSGFDTGSGLPKITNKKIAFFWKQGDYTNKDLSLLEDDAKVNIPGDISSTLEEFVSRSKKLD